jgi:hypothetical protein
VKLLNFVPSGKYAAPLLHQQEEGGVSGLDGIATLLDKVVYAQVRHLTYYGAEDSSNGGA